MNTKKKLLLQEIKRIIVGTTCAPKAVNKLVRLGFAVESRKGHYYLRHPEVRGRLSLGSSPSDRRWQLNFLRELKYMLAAS